MPLNYGAGEDSRIPQTARRSIQSILKEINPEYSLEGLMLKLKCQYFGHLMQRVDLLKKTLMLGKIEGRRRRRQQDEMVVRHHRLHGHDSGRWRRTGKPGVLQSMRSQTVGCDWVTEHDAEELQVFKQILSPQGWGSITPHLLFLLPIQTDLYFKA